MERIKSIIIFFVLRMKCFAVNNSNNKCAWPFDIFGCYGCLYFIKEINGFKKRRKTQKGYKN